VDPEGLYQRGGVNPCLPEHRIALGAVKCHLNVELQGVWAQNGSAFLGISAKDPLHGLLRPTSVITPPIHPRY